MKLSARRIQAVSSMGFSWGAVWGVAGVLLARLPSSDSDLPLPLVFAPLGIACGVLFSALLAAVAGGRGFERLSLVRGAAWGAVSGLLLTAVIVAGAAFRGADLWEEFLVFGPPLTLASAVCAVGSVVVARRRESTLKRHHVMRH
jgi:hypothetical protein